MAAPMVAVWDILKAGRLAAQKDVSRDSLRVVLWGDSLAVALVVPTVYN